MPLYIIAFVGFINDEKQEKNDLRIFNKKINLQLLKIIGLSIISIIILAIIPSITSAFILCLIYLIIGTVKLIKIKQNVKRNLLILWGVPIILAEFIINFLFKEIHPYPSAWLSGLYVATNLSNL